MDEGHCSQGAHWWVWSHTPKDPKSNAQNIRRPWWLWKKGKSLQGRAPWQPQTIDDKPGNVLTIYIKHHSVLTRALGVGGGSPESLPLYNWELHSESLSDVPTLSQAANGPASKDHAGLRTPTIAKSETILPNTLPPSSTWRIFTVYSTGARVHHARNKVGQGIHELSTQNQRRWIDWIKPLLPVNTNPSCLQPSVFQTETWNYLC